MILVIITNIIVYILILIKLNSISKQQSMLCNKILPVSDLTLDLALLKQSALTINNISEILTPLIDLSVKKAVIDSNANILDKLIVDEVTISELKENQTNILSSINQFAITFNTKVKNLEKITELSSNRITQIENKL